MVGPLLVTAVVLTHGLAGWAVFGALLAGAGQLTVPAAGWAERVRTPVAAASGPLAYPASRSRTCPVSLRLTMPRRPSLAAPIRVSEQYAGANQIAFS